MLSASLFLVSPIPHEYHSQGKRSFSIKPTRENLHDWVGVAPRQISSVWTITTAKYCICWISSSYPCLFPFITASTDAGALLALLIGMGVHLLPKGEEKEAWPSPWDAPSGSLLSGNADHSTRSRGGSAITQSVSSEACFFQSLFARPSFSGLWWKKPTKLPAVWPQNHFHCPQPSAASQLCFFLALWREQVWLSRSSLILCKPPAPLGP